MRNVAADGVGEHPKNNLHLPTISVVTICRNARATVERAVTSVIGSSYPALQYVVVDGASTDGTLDVLERYRSRIDKLVSEPDLGISDALNKAISLTDGEYHLVVHADDELMPGALEWLGGAAGEHAQVICGNVEVVRNGKVARVFKPEPAKLWQKMSVPHMGSLMRRDAWELVGGYDLRRKIAMDHLYMLRILRRFGVHAFRSVDKVVARYSLGGVSDEMIIHGFRELRENLREEGVGRLAANQAFAVLVLKARIARLIGRQ